MVEFDEKTKKKISETRKKIEHRRIEYEAKYRETPCYYAGRKDRGCVLCKGLIYDRIEECETFRWGRRHNIELIEGIKGPHDW